MSKQYEVELYYSGLVTMQIEADDEEDAQAIASEKAAQLFDKEDGKLTGELLSSMERWEDADTISEIKYGSI